MINADTEITDNSGPFLEALARAQQAGLHNAAQTYRNDMKKALRSGGKGFVFKTTIGNVGHIVRGKRRPWTTGLLWNSITLDDMVAFGAGWAIRVGTNVKYALFWELGHHNIYTKHFERDPKWVPTFQQNRGRYSAAFQSAFKRVLSAFASQTQSGAKS